MAAVGLSTEAGQQELVQAIQSFKEAIAHIRTGVATPDIVREIKIEAYGSTQMLEHVATVNVMSARSLSIKPWDPSLRQAVDEAVRKARPDYEISSNQDQIIVNLPALTEESRKEYVKVLKEKTEQYRQRIRDIRHRMRDFWQEQKEGMPENDFFKALENVDKITTQTNDELEQVYTKKSDELLKV